MLSEAGTLVYALIYIYIYCI